MQHKNLIQKIGFQPKNGSTDIFIKKYPNHSNYSIEVDFEKNKFNYGKLIKTGNQNILNFSPEENWVTLECVDRLLQKGYKPENIILEKSYPAGHGFSGRLDVCVTRNDGSEYLLIECKTYGKEFDKAVTRLNKDGGQLFTYFKFSNKPDVIMLYASELNGGEIIYKNEIVKIEDDYRTPGDVKDFYDKWNKLTKDNGVFDDWVNPYEFISKALTIKMLEPIKQEDSSFIFNRFLEILRHNVVSDKPNAFNKIFTLFLCKIYDEKFNEGTDNELGFQWLEGKDDDISFQLRLTDLYKNGMYEFLEKKVTDFSEDEFENKFGKNLDESVKNDLLAEFKKIRLEKNNEFAIKEVYDKKSFTENAKVVKEVVELLQGFKIRYTKKQQYLSDFFELLLTTGLKQESGQFFTPVPIAQFIIKSLPIDTVVEEKLQKGENNNLLPFVMDYAAGSGHFLTETMHEMQRLIDQKDDKKYNPTTAKKVRAWKDDHFDWAIDYVYGIEKDYRLVKVGKVGCYLHGDGLANVIHTDGLANFNHADYKGKLKHTDKDFPQDNKQFDIIVSNPPYSVSAFKNAAREYYRENDFELYDRLTENSSEIECLFIERTKQLLKDGGVAGIILPSSILSNSGLYAKSRELILQYFDIIAIAELGSNTFMATGTNTVTLFLRRRNNYESINLQKAVDKLFINLKDVTTNSIEKPITKYIQHVWENITFDDYITLLQKAPNKAIEEHEIYIEYTKKIKAKNDKEFWDILIDKEKEKLYYFIIALPQKVVLIKSGEKDAEKRFLGYEFSNRRGSEGIHPIRRGKNIEDCTALFDPEIFDNPAKASTYIYKAFKGDFDFAIDDAIQQNVSRHNLVDMLTFNRVEFEKNISLSVKKKVKIESKWPNKRLDDVALIIKGVTYSKEDQTSNKTKKVILTADNITLEGHLQIKKEIFLNDNFTISEDKKLKINDIFICFSSGSKEHLGKVAFINKNIDFYAGGFMGIIRVNKNSNAQYIYQLLNTILRQTIRDIGSGSNINNLSGILNEVKIPFPPILIQEKIVAECQAIDEERTTFKQEVENLKNKIKKLIEKVFTQKYEQEKISSFSVVNPSKTEIKDIDDDTIVSFIEMASVSENGKIINTVDKPLKELRKGSYTYFRDNDIIIAKITPCMENGKCALAQGLSNGIGLGSSEFHVIRTNETVNNKYLFSILNREIVRKEAEKNMTGSSGHRRVPASYYENFEVPILPLIEQEKLAKEIEVIEAKIARLEEEIAAIPQQKELVLKKYL